MKYTGLESIDLHQFPKQVKLKHGRDGEREWWEWWDNLRRKDRKGIVIQRPTQKLPFCIFFTQGEVMRSLSLPLTEAERQRRVVSKAYSAYTIGQAIEVLAELGIGVTL